MKTPGFIALVLACGAISYLSGCGKKSVEVNRDTEANEEQVSDEIAKLLRENRRLKAVKSRVEIVEKKVVVLASSAESPEAILDYLSKLELKSQNRSTGNTDAHRIQVRQVIRQFEELTSMGSEALPAIADFLGRDVDLEYKEATDEIVSGNWSRGQIYTDPIFPPSLRIGLLNTVRHIGKRDVESLEGAVSILSGVLKTTGRAIEVLYIERALQDMAKDIHTDTFLMAAKDLLMEPIREEGREVSYLDRQNRGGLFDLLRRHKDASFVEQAKTQLLRDRKRTERKDGKEIEVMVTEIDRSVLEYLTGVLADGAMPILRNLYDKPDLGDRNRSTIRQVAARYMGVSEDANIIVNSRVNEAFQMLATTGDKQKENRGRGLGTISYYLSRMGEGKNVPIETIQSRQQYLSTLRVQTQDKEVLAWMDNVDRRLNDMSDPEKAKKLDSRFDSRRKPDQKRERR
ncbi:MAG: hypothetical protein QF685_04160 [Verrucomicrobiota bacterium]|jgi:hypothetical protein|nr:hypothetical protein [Verrucomicrobiota bacterium]